MTEPASTKHLDLLQGVIARMAANSFVIKGWSVTVAAAILGLAAKDGGPGFVWIGYLVVGLFWILDAYYLALERAFRDLFAAAVARRTAGTEENFDMKAVIPPGGIGLAATTGATAMVHAPLLVALVVAHLLLTRAHPGG